MEKIKEEIFKTTLRKPVNKQSQNLEKNYKKTVNQYVPNIKLNEIDDTLSEAEQSLKKKIFSLSKMEALVFSDPKLSAVYDEMSVNGEEKYGYHYNETIMNMLFNDYVLNSPKYLQKYKMAIPKEKKRRDQSGINQLKKAGEEIMKKQTSLAPSGLPKQVKKPEVKEYVALKTKVQFLVNEKDPENPDVFAYFPEEAHNAQFKMGYSHVGQHSAVHPAYAAESRPATPEEYQDLKAELESIGYDLEVIEATNETTGSGSSGAYTGAAMWKKGGDLMEEPEKVEETTSAGSAGGAAGYVGYAGPAAWGSGDLMKKGKTNPLLRKPIWKMGTIIQESDYLTDPVGFEKYVNEFDRENVNDIIVDKTAAFTSGAVKNWNDKDANLELNTIKTGNPDEPNFDTMEEGISPDMYSTKEDLKQLVQSVKERTGKGLTKDHIPMLASEALYTIAIQLANSYLRRKGIPVSWDELGDTNSMWDYIDENGNMSFDRLMEAVKEATDERLGNEGFEGMPMDEMAKSKRQQRFMGMVHAVQKGELSPSKVGGDVERAAKSMTKKDAEDFASTKHKGLPEKVDEIYPDALIDKDVIDIKPQKGEKPFILNDKKYQYEIAKYADGHMDNVVYSFSDDVYYDYRKWRELMGLQENNIKEDTQTMIQNNGTSMSNKAVPTGDQSSNMDMGARSTGGMKEELEQANKLLEEINKELDAFSIHQNKLKKMAEERKPSALVLRDRVGSENEKNFKSDLGQSGTKEIIDIEKELQWKDQQTDVDKDPQKLGQDLEKKEIKVTDAEGEEYLKNVGDSANDKGDEIPKRNMTSKEQHDVDMHRLGQQDLVYDNEPGKRFEDRMKADMGEELYKQRQEKMKWRSEAPMYNKDPQPVIDPTAVDKVQFNKEKSTWNEREGLKETMITGRFVDGLGKKYIKDFRLNEAKIVKNVKDVEDMFELDFTGFGNKYKGKTEDNKVLVNEGVDTVLSENKFFTDGKEVFALKNPVQKLNEAALKTKPVINEQFEKMKHLSDYKPESFTDTKNVKKNRGF